MSVVIRLMRAGAKRRPFYRVVAADSRRQRDGRFLEILGHYDPLSNPLDLKLKAEKIEKWITRGAQPSVQVASLLKRAGLKMPKPAPKAETDGAAEAKPAKKPVKRRVQRKVSARNAGRKVARKAGKMKPAVKKPKKKRT